MQIRSECLVMPSLSCSCPPAAPQQRDHHHSGRRWFWPWFRFMLVPLVDCIAHYEFVFIDIRWFDPVWWWIVQIIVWQVGFGLAPYVAATGIDPLLTTFILTVVNVTVNSYLGVPLMHSQFGEWLNMSRPVKPHYPWLAFLDNGLSFLGQLALVGFYLLMNLLGGYVFWN